MKRMALKHLLAASFVVVGGVQSFANPTGGQIASGSATITTVPGTVTINQASNIAIINWQSFSIGAGELTKFVQPSATSAALNRVLGGGVSTINGTLTANGQIYLINGNGIVVGPTGSVTASTFVASTRDINDADFLSGNLHFTGNNSAGVQNLGTINGLGGDVYLFGKTVDNEGAINAPCGTVGLASGDDVMLNLGGQEHVFVNPSPTATAATTKVAVQNGGTITSANAELKAANGNMFALAINNAGTIRANAVSQQGGRIFLTTDSGMMQNTGVLSAKNCGNGGNVKIKGGSFWNRNTIDASGKNGGQVTVDVWNVQNDGLIDISGSQGCGGTADFTYSGNALGSIKGLINASGKTAGGNIYFTGTGLTSEAYLSLTLNVNSRCGKAGDIGISTSTLYLTGATVTANGATGGGNIFLGQSLPNSSLLLNTAKVAYVSLGTSIQANATVCGDGGQVGITGTVINQFYGIAQAKGRGAHSNDGMVTLTGPSAVANAVVMNAKIASAATQASGTVTPPTKPTFAFADPNAGPGNAFGRPYTGLFNLTGNTTLITSPGDSFGGTSAGAAYLFSDNNGALLSTIRGSHVNDNVGASVVLMGNGKFAIDTPNWNSNVGAVTFGNSKTGFANGGGAVSATNSLIGANAGDMIGSDGLIVLNNGNVLVMSPLFNNNAGAVTFVKPANGMTGVVDSTNSLVGAASGDSIGSGGIQQLSNGSNYLVLSPLFSGGKGAITNGSNTTAMTGVVSSSNSLVGAATGDAVGTLGTINDTGLGYYLVLNSNYGNGAGAVTWNSDNGGTTGVLSSFNSMVGAAAGDNIGSGGITLLNASGNYVINSPDWNNGAGAVTIGSGANGITGAVSMFNSLVGSVSGEHVGGGGIQELSNGEVLVFTPNYGNGAGAITFLDAVAVSTGQLDNFNSLVGASAGDNIGSGGIVELSNGASFLVLSPDWNGGKGAITVGSNTMGVTGIVGSDNSLVGAANTDHVGSAGSIIDSLSNYFLVKIPGFDGGAGAVTWSDDVNATTGVISDANSLIGSSNGDHIGSGLVQALNDGTYVVVSPDWNNNTGAVSVGSNTGVSGFVGAGNSIVGAASGDSIGSGGIQNLINGRNFVILSPNWGGGKGAVTNVDSLDPTFGVVSASNSLVGASTADDVGSIGSIIQATSGYYLVATPGFNQNAGAVTWSDESTGRVGVIGSGNSLVGSAANDNVGGSGITFLSNGNYIVNSPDWNGLRGAVTLGDASGGATGFVSSANSLVGSAAGDMIGSGGIVSLSGGNFVVLSSIWNNNAGAVTWGDESATSTFHGVVSSANSLVGATSGDMIGSDGVLELSDGTHYLVMSSNFEGGKGAITQASEAAGITSVVSSANSLVGAAAGDAVGAQGSVFDTSRGYYLVTTSNFNGGGGAVTFNSDNAGTTGVISSSNSLVGSNAGDAIGNGGIAVLNNGNYVVISSDWNNGKGAVTVGNKTTGVSGVMGAANSLVGATAGDHIGSQGISEFASSNFLVLSSGFNGGAGAVTFVKGTSGLDAVVSSANSLVGSTSGDALGSGGIQYLANGNYLVLTPQFNGGAGAVTFGSSTAGVSGVLGAANSLVGSDSSDHIGDGGIILLSNGNYLVQSPLFNGSAGAVTWGSQLTGVRGAVNSKNSITGGGPDSGEQYAGESSAGNIFLVSFTTDTSGGGDGRVVAGSVLGPGQGSPSLPNFFIDPAVLSFEAAEYNYVLAVREFYIADPSTMGVRGASVDALEGGAVNGSHGGNNIASGSSTASASGPKRLVVPGNGIWNIFSGTVHSTPPPAFIAQQLQFNLSPEIYSQLSSILFGKP